MIKSNFDKTLWNNYNHHYFILRIGNLCDSQRKLWIFYFCDLCWRFFKLVNLQFLVRRLMAMSRRCRLSGSLRRWAVGWMEIRLLQANGASCLNVLHSVVQRLWDQLESENSVKKTCSRPLVVPVCFAGIQIERWSGLNKASDATNIILLKYTVCGIMASIWICLGGHLDLHV